MKTVSIFFCCLLSPLCLFAQTLPDMSYRRSSLNVVFVKDYDNLKQSERRIIDEIMTSYPLPDKYNDHSVGNKIIDVSSIQVNSDETKPYERGLIGDLFNYIGSNVKATFGFIDVSASDPQYIAKLYKYCESQNIADQSVAKWFNMSSTRIDGSYFNMKLIQERGAYNASELDKLRSKESIRGEAILKDAGMDLIPNTFTVFIRLHYMTRAEWDIMMAERFEDIAKQNEKKAAKAEGETRNKLLINAREYREMAANYRTAATVDKGYFISATSYLYQLEWDDNDANHFLANYFTDNPKNIMGNGAYHMKFIGKANSQCRTSIFSLDDEADLVKTATIRSIDKTFAKLQSEYEVFAIKTPIISVDNKIATAFIGTKEGITPKSKFEVLELRYNETKNVFKYVRVGKLSVEKGKVWNNIYSSDNDDGIEDEEEAFKGDKNLDRTYLKGASASIVPGMIIRQIK